MDTPVFTEPSPDSALAPDSFVARHRLPNPFPLNPKRSETRLLAGKRRQAKFLAVYAMTGIVRDALIAAGSTRGTLDSWRTRDARFEMLYRQAAEEANDRIEAEVLRRSVEGWEETTTVQKDGETYTKTVRRYSDNLLALLIKSRKREFREQKVNATVNQTTNNLAVVPIERLTDDEFALLGRIMGKTGPKPVSRKVPALEG